MRIFLTASAVPFLFAWADRIWPEGVDVSPEDEERACQIWATIAKVRK